MSNGLLQEILDWSRDRPAWQRDALRRLFTAGEIKAEELDDLVELCKTPYGLSNHVKAEVLAKEHLAIREAGSEAISLVNVTHNGGVNALAANQTVTFGPNLTVVYGANAAGKSGYTRILKLACRSRFSAPILSNVLSGAQPLKPQVTISFKNGSTEVTPPWTSNLPGSNALAAVSVFDAQCVPAYLRNKTDVAFRPFSLDVFDKLSTACGDVRGRLEIEQTRLSGAAPKLPTFPEGTRAHTLVTTLTSLTKVEDVKALAVPSVEDQTKLKGFQDQQRDLQAADPKKRAREITLKADRIDAVVRHVSGFVEMFSQTSLTELRALARTKAVAQATLLALRNSTLTSGLLPGTGEQSWREMWESAGNFSSVAYNGEQFPFLTDGARCPLCQQVIGSDATARLKHFAEYISSNAQADARKAEHDFSSTIQKISKATIEREDIKLAINELDSDNPGLAKHVRSFLQEAVQFQLEIKKAAYQDLEIPPILFSLIPLADMEAATKSLRDRALQLQNDNPAMTPQALHELKELESRAALAQHQQAVFDEIERKKQLAAYQQCLDDTNTQPITRKSTELTKRLITDKLRDTFQKELIKSDFRHLAVEIRSAGGTRGALFHQLVFTNAPGVTVTDVLSEGESRTLSLAAFLTELSTAPTKSAIIFDDPVSSLDHIWRQRIARRLVGESKERQVVVFTHDILFLRFLMDECRLQDSQCHHQYIRRDGEAGICSSDLPWIAMNTKDRIGTMRAQFQNAEKSFRTSVDNYERDARHIYGLLREAWEHAIGEILLNDVVERYRHSIESQKVRFLHDITEADCKLVETEMSECSRWIRGHDQAPADGTPVPEPAELKKRIDKLDEWRRAIQKRR